MKNKILITIASVLFLSFSMLAQPNKEDKRKEQKENIESMKVAFITQKLDLTAVEAQQFWPVYNQYTAKLDELRKQRRMGNREAKKNMDELSDKEVEQVVDNEIIFRQKELDLQKEYHAKIKSILPIKKVAKLYAAEDQFKRVLLDKLKEKNRNSEK